MLLVVRITSYETSLAFTTAGVGVTETPLTLVVVLWAMLYADDVPTGVFCDVYA